MKNLTINHFLGPSSLAAMAVLFGGILSGVAAMLGRGSAAPDALAVD